MSLRQFGLTVVLSTAALCACGDDKGSTSSSSSGGSTSGTVSSSGEDTIIIPAKQSLKLVARFDEPGSWMYHCHILEHGEHGMMGELRVE